MSKAHILLIGVGNEFRGDDAAGLLVAKALAAAAIPGVKVIEETGDATRLLNTWSGFDRVILVDAVRSASKPGTIQRFEAHAGPIPSGWFAVSSHSLGVADAIELARQTHQLPMELVVYGISGAEFGMGKPVSAAVTAGAKKALRAVRAEIRRHLS